MNDASNDVLRLESNQSTQLRIMSGFILFGVFFIYIAVHAQQGMTTVYAVLCGLLFISIGGFNILWANKRTVSINKKTREIITEDTNRFSTKRRVIPFDEVIHVSTQMFSPLSSGRIPSYDVVLSLRSDEQYQLFISAYFPGQFFSRTASDKRKDQIVQILK